MSPISRKSKSLIIDYSALDRQGRLDLTRGDEPTYDSTGSSSVRGMLGAF
jgi:hypothetical protein